jgi:hypothetical protein
MRLLGGSLKIALSQFSGRLFGMPVSGIELMTDPRKHPSAAFWATVVVVFWAIL